MEIREIAPEQTWQIRQRVLWPDKSIDYIKLPKDKEGRHYGLFVEERLLSVISVFIHATEAQFRKFATLQEEQGKGYGSQLLSHLLSELGQKQVLKVWCNARVKKKAFYEAFGMQATKHTFSKGGVEFVRMEISLES